MGRPSIIKPVRVGSSRRAFFKSSGSAAAALVAAPLLPLAGTAEAVAISSNFQHGVASGDPLSDRVILWTRVTPTNGRSAQVVDYSIAKDPAFTQIVSSGRSKAILERDFTVKIDALGLSPNTTYYYRFSVDGVISPIGRTKTLPVGGVSNLRMAVVSCSNHAYGYFNAYRRIAERADLDMVVHLGDYIYEYGAGQYGNVRTPEPTNEIVTLADYRMRHAQYKRDPDSQAMHRQHPLVAIWDDHETANNAYVDGAENHQASEGAWAARVGAALQAYYEWMPVRVVDPAKPRNNARSYAFGNLVDLIMLEERLNGRSAQLGTNIGNASGYFIQAGAYLDPARQLLGASEEAWLFNKLRSSTAKWKFLGQGVMFAQVKVQGAPNSAGGGVFFNSDAWDGYQPARDRVYDVLKGNSSLGQAPVNNVVILTGDIHSSWAADLSQDPNNANVATGGYDKVTGQGSRAVEFVGTSISSPGVDNPAQAAGTIAALAPANPHLKYINLDKRGYMLIDADATRCVCEWWYVDTVASVSNVQTFATAFQVVDGANRLTPAAQTPNRANPPALAP
ncbi:alkaline phosphatase D family protein [Paucibacter sp. B2R-40]|uniref:alkaline phosphatase D family protein n=1 Tax=Paucibacter sp. B2R-40 TaxID=2893554 RepID=UPI0021E3C096|nr:alkaline phosphatase D family protein [Paucibacter sp. B2R-40]MCV2355295.1 alkaline phosphatase D family protein [Paucibacter sp. B2R-40]